MEQQKFIFNAPYKLGDRLRVKSPEFFNWAWPDKSFYVIGTVVAIIEKGQEISDDMIMHYYGKLMKGLNKSKYDRIMLKDDYGHYIVAPYRPEKYVFNKVEELKTKGEIHE